MPADRIETVGGINTAAELRVLAETIPKTERVGLITSASHMHRAMRLARGAGLSAQPLPAGFRTRRTGELNAAGVMLSVIPNSEAITNSTLALREIFASFVGR